MTKLSVLALTIAFVVLTVRAEDAAPNPIAVLIQTLGKIDNPEAQVSILRGLNTSLKGKPGVVEPPEWAELYAKLKTSPSAEVRQQAQALAAVFGGAVAIDEFRKKLADSSATPEARQFALASLLAAKDQQILPILIELVKNPGPLRAPSLRGLAGYDDKIIPVAILAVFKTLTADEKRDALNTLVSRSASASALLAAIDAKALNRTEISAPLARQLQNLRDPKIADWLSKNWGAVRTSPADKQKEIEQFKKFLGTDAILAADARKGREHFNQRCAVCHTLHGEGAKIGPELPGSFKDVDYLLLNLLDPNAQIGKDYQQTFIYTRDGQLLSGIITADDATSVSLNTLAGPVSVRRADIKTLETGDQSLMPEGLLTGMEEQSVRDLFLYLRGAAQVPLPEGSTP